MPGHTRERIGKVDFLYVFENVLHETFKHIYDVFLLHEAHLAVYLSELRLAVGAQVFISEAFCNLEITVVSAHHKQLLEKLRALRQSIELPGIHARRNHEVACPFRRGFHENRGLDFQESL